MSIFRSLGCFIALSGLALAASGCDEERAFYIIQNQVPQGGCTVSTDSTLYRADGVLDVSVGQGYSFYPLLHNAMPARGGSTDRPERNMLQLREFRVRLVGVGETSVEIVQATSGLLFPGEKRAATVEIIPAQVVSSLKLPAGARRSAKAEIVAVAESGDGAVVESMPFIYPVSLCNGCLVTLLESCPATEAEATGVSSNACGLPQDAPVTCCSSSGALRCLAGE